MSAERGTANGLRGDGGEPSKGFALFVVLWFLVLLAAIGTYILASARTQSALARNILASAHAEALADAAVAQAVFNQSEGDPAKRWALDGTPYRVVLTGGTLVLRLHDERTKINPNLAEPALISALFQALGMGPPQASGLAAAVVDWTRQAKKSAAPGTDQDAFRNAYENAGRDYGAPHRPMESLDELQLVLGMTPQLYASAAPYLTIYTDGEPPDPRTAPAIVQLALAIAASAPGGASQNAAAAAPQSDATADTNAAPAAATTMTQPAAGAGAAPAGAQAGPAQPQAPPVLNIEAVATSNDGGVFARHAIVKIDPDQPAGYSVLLWERAEITP
jgi:general secretion pathway protein K